MANRRGSARNVQLIRLATLVAIGIGGVEWSGCSGKRLHVGDNGSGGHAGGGGGQAGAVAGGAGATSTPGTAGTPGSAGTPGTAGTTGAAGGGGAIMPAGSGGSAAGGATSSGGSAGPGGAIGSGGAAGQSGSGGTTTASLALLAGGLGGPGNLDGMGAGARFYGATGVASDGAGNLYVTDWGNDVIRKVEIATGVVTTFAGAPGVGGNVDAAGTAARFAAPKSIVSDGAGNFYVADEYNASIRKIEIATGAVTTLAGPATGNFYDPEGIVSDGAGALYVVDCGHSLIKKVVIATGAVTIFAGALNQNDAVDATGAAARFDTPLGITSDGAGNLYVADTNNHTIRKIVIATAAVTTLAGAAAQLGSADGIGAAARFNRPGAIVSDGAGNLYVTDTNNSTLRKVVIATGAVTTVAGAPGQTPNAVGQTPSVDGTGAAARFAAPFGITGDGAGNLYVADSGAIRKVVMATRAVTTVAGAVGQYSGADGTGATARFSFPQGVASDGAGNLYVADSKNDTVRRIVVATGAVTTLAGAVGQSGAVDGTGSAARFSGPKGIASDGAGNLYVADEMNYSIRKVVIATGAVSTLAGTGFWNHTDGTGTAAAFNDPAALVSDGAGNLYVSDSNSIRKIVIASRAVSTLAMLPGRIDEDAAPLGIAADGAGNLYVSDYASILKVVIATGAVTTFAGAGPAGTADGVGTSAAFASPKNIASDGAGSLYVADGNTVRKIALDTATVSTLIGLPGQTGVSLGALPASLNVPYGVAVLPAGGIAIVDSAENSVLVGRF